MSIVVDIKSTWCHSLNMDNAATFNGSNFVIHTGTDERGDIDSVWVECAADMSDADVQASAELSANLGSENAKAALAAMRGEFWVNILHPREPNVRVYLDGPF